MLIIGALVDFGKFSATICFPLEFLGFIRGNDAGIALEGTARKHQTHPFNELILHKTEVFLFNWREDLPYFVS